MRIAITCIGSDCKVGDSSPHGELKIVVSAGMGVP
jgi:hypothetical protein